MIGTSTIQILALRFEIVFFYILTGLFPTQDKGINWQKVNCKKSSKLVETNPFSFGKKRYFLEERDFDMLINFGHIVPCFILTKR